MTIEILQKALYKLERLSLVVALEYRNYIYWNVKKKTKDEILKYLPVLRKAEEILLFKRGWCENDDICWGVIEKIVGKVNSSIIFNERKRKDIVVEKDNKWAILHPDCLTYSRWEKLSHLICDSLDIKVEVTKKMCDLTYSLSKDIINCEIFAAITTYNKACKLGYKIKIDEQKCNAEFNLLIEKYPECNLDYKLYVDLKKCGLTYDIVETIICKGGLNVYIKENEAILHTSLGEINMNSDLQVNSIIEPEKCRDTLCKSKGTYNTSNREFLELLACDYNLSNKDKNELFKTLV